MFRVQGPVSRYHVASDFVRGALAFALTVGVAGCGGALAPSPTEDTHANLPGDAPAQQGETERESSVEVVAEGDFGPSAVVTTAESVLFTTRWNMLAGERVDAGALYAVDKRVGSPLLLAVDRRGAAWDALVSDGADAFIAASDGRLLAVPVMGGEVRTVAELPIAAAFLAVSGEHLYYASEAGDVGRAPKVGGDPESLGTAPSAHVRGLEVDGSSIFVALGPEGERGGTVVRLPLEGGEAETALDVPAGATPCAMTRGEGRLLVTSVPRDAAISADGAVLAVDLRGGAVATLASGRFSACAVAGDGADVFFAAARPGIFNVRAGVSSTTADEAGLGIMRAPLAGGAAVPVAGAAGALAKPGALTVDAEHLYWLSARAVSRVRK